MMLQADTMPVIEITKHARCEISKVWKDLIIEHQALEQASVCLYQGRNADCIFHQSRVERQLHYFFTAIQKYNK